MKALILAGGKGSRIQEITKGESKNVLEVYGKPLVEYNLDQAVKIGVKEIIIVLCHKPKAVISAIGKKYRGIKVTYIIEKEGQGLVNAIWNARKALGGSDFFLMLGDEIVQEGDITGMYEHFHQKEAMVTCGVVLERDKSSISKTYNLMTNEKGRILRLVEKPKFPVTDLKGTGHCMFKNEILDYIEKTPLDPERKRKELVGLIQAAVDEGRKAYAYPITKRYVNVNTYEDYQIAKDIIRKRLPKVLIVHNQMKYYGGAELLIVEMANCLTKMGIKNDILTQSKSEKVEQDLINTRLIIPKNNVNLAPPGYKNFKHLLKGFKVLRRALRKIENNYDVINLHDFPTTWALFPRKKPAVWFMNMPPNLWSRPNASFYLRTQNKIRNIIDKYIIRNSIDIITVIENSNLLRAKQRYRKKARMLYFGINYDFFSRGNAKKAINNHELQNKFVIIHSGQVSEDKNQLASIKAVEKLKNKIPNIKLIITGGDEPNYKKKLENYIKEKKLEKYVLFTGFLKTRNELRDLFKAANLGLFPIGKQGGVLAPFEVICAGTPVIISEDMETASMFKHFDFGIVTKNYVNAIYEIYKNQEKYNEQAKRAKKFTKENLTWKVFSEGMAEAFKDAWRKYK
tara:strand:- start:396 stop:2273 length:1878 start_codon:yes stop_codon:yes gene_type:complete